MTLTTLWCAAKWSSVRRVCTVRERRADLASTSAKHAIKEKCRSLRKCWRILFLAHPLQMPKTDAREMLSTTPPCPPLANRPASQLIVSKPAQKKWHQPSRPMTPAIEAKRNALTAYKANPSEQNLQILLAAGSKVQQRPSQCASDYWLQLCSQIQIAADTGNIKAMYDGIMQALGPMQKKTASLRSTTGEVIQDREQQMELWVEHYTELYARGNLVTEDALNAIECLPELK